MNKRKRVAARKHRRQKKRLKLKRHQVAASGEARAREGRAAR